MNEEQRLQKRIQSLRTHNKDQAQLLQQRDYEIVSLRAKIARVDGLWEDASKNFERLLRSNTSLSRKMDRIRGHKIRAWLSAALNDDMVCNKMKADIRDWFGVVK